MEPLIIIPDIQGEYEMLVGLIEELKSKDALNGRKLAFLGDYMDRGEGTKPLFDLLIELQSEGAIFVRGNHEDIFIKAIMSDEQNDEVARDLWIYQWLKHESNTLWSYGISREGKSGIKLFNIFKEKLEESGHLDFITNLPYYIEYQSMILIHAGIKDNVMWESQKKQLDEDICKYDSMPEQIYSSELAEMTYHADHDKCVVSGHTPRIKPFISKKRVMLDCGAGKPGQPLVAWLSDTKEVVYYFKN